LENCTALRQILDKSEFLETTSNMHSPIIHYRLNPPAISLFSLSFSEQERLLQEIIDEVTPLHPRV
jgi:hypothetical protein